VKLALQGPGTMFGEAGLFSGRPRSATGWAREDSILLEIDRPAFDRLFEEHSIVAFKFFDAAIVLLTELMRRALVRQAWFETERRGLLS
jgi:CRP-like cAMP-binding protein